MDTGKSRGKKMQFHAKLPMSSNKDICEKNQVAEEWRNLNQERRGVYSLSIGSLFVVRQVQVIGSNLTKYNEAVFLLPTLKGLGIRKTRFIWHTPIP